MILIEPDETNMNGFIQSWNINGIVSDRVSVSSSPFTTGYPPTYSLNDEATYFHSDESMENPYIIYNLKQDVLMIHSYTIKSRHLYSVASLNSWNLSASLDGIQWNIIDVRSNTDLHGNNIVINYDVMKRGVYQTFKLTMTSRSTDNRKIFTFRSFDLFGILNPDLTQRQSCLCPPFFSLSKITTLFCTILLNQNMYL